MTGLKISITGCVRMAVNAAAYVQQQTCNFTEMACKCWKLWQNLLKVECQSLTSPSSCWARI